MKKIHQSIYIHASRARVWDTMLSPATYTKWTAPFGGSTFQGSFDEGAEIRFLGTDANGNALDGGMWSKIAECRLHESLSIKHVGIIMGDVVDSESEMAKKWTPAFENYTLVDEDDGTRLTIDLDIPEDEFATFDEMWKQALLKLKSLCQEE